MIKSVSVVGLGYVGLPLLVNLSKLETFRVIGLDQSKRKIDSLKKGISYIDDIKSSEIKKLKFVPKFSTSIQSLKNTDYILICLPTPINETKEPDNSILISFIKDLPKINLKGKVICLESTVILVLLKNYFYHCLKHKS